MLKAAVKAAKDTATRRSSCWSRRATYFRTIALDYHGGLRYPRLERIPGTKDRFALIFKPLP